MDIIVLNNENITEYEDYIAPDAAENLSREYYRGLVVCDDTEPLAALIWELIYYEDYDNDTEAKLIWIKVSDDAAYKDLLNEYSEMARRDGVVRTSFEFSDDELKEYKDLLADEGFKIKEQEGSDLMFTVGDLKLLRIAKLLKTPSYICNLGMLKNRSFRRGIVDCVYNIKRRLPEDIIRLPMEWFEPEISCYEESDGDSNGFLLIHKCPSGRLKIELLADWGPDAKKELVHMIAFTLKRAFEIYPDDTEIILHRFDEPSRKLAGYFFPQLKGNVGIFGTRTE
ncbi:MAG: hypothetical protein K6G12_02435 [Lachnospiraceae bacterium]|nr:hypothetical protein [Lachnospiraceae bacterium]